MYRRSFAFLVTLGFLAIPRIAAGCVIAPKPTVLKAYKDSDVVVIARAISMEKASDQSAIPPTGNPVLSTKMEVQKVFKGNLSIGDKLTFGQGTASQLHLGFLRS